MTRDEFINEVTTFDDLVCFCNTNGLEHIVEYIRDGEDYENYLDELFRDMIYDYGWREARDQMNNVDNDGYDWYETSYGDWVSINEDDNLDEYKDQVIEAMDRDEAWDEPEEPDQEPEPEEEEEDDEYLDICPQEIDADGLMAENSGFLAMVLEKEYQDIESEADEVERGNDDEEAEQLEEDPFQPHADLSELLPTA